MDVAYIFRWSLIAFFIAHLYMKLNKQMYADVLDIRAMYNMDRSLVFTDRFQDETIDPRENHLP